LAASFNSRALEIRLAETEGRFPLARFDLLSVEGITELFLISRPRSNTGAIIIPVEELSADRWQFIYPARK
jgi:hypothetical protein